MCYIKEAKTDSFQEAGIHFQTKCKVKCFHLRCAFLISLICYILHENLNSDKLKWIENTHNHMRALNMAQQLDRANLQQQLTMWSGAV